MMETATMANKLRSLAASIAEIADALSAQPSEQKQPISLEQVREVLAEKSQDGCTAEVRALLEKHGAKRLSEIDPVKYPTLLADAEALSHD